MNDDKKTDEALELASQVLLRCTLLGVVVLLFWAGFMALCGDLTYRVHARIFPISRQHFHLVHYTGILLTKAAVSLLFFLPFVAVQMVRKKRK